MSQWHAVMLGHSNLTPPPLSRYAHSNVVPYQPDVNQQHRASAAPQAQQLLSPTYPSPLVDAPSDIGEVVSLLVPGDASSEGKKLEGLVLQRAGRSLTPDGHLRWLAQQHTRDQMAWEDAGGQYTDQCNMHSWLYKTPTGTT